MLAKVKNENKPISLVAPLIFLTLLPSPRFLNAVKHFVAKLV